MHIAPALIVGGSIGAPTASFATRKNGINVDIFGRDPECNISGVGIMQSLNVIRATGKLGAVHLCRSAPRPKRPRCKP